jgi:5-deoxy-glucuronate isomerase
VPEESQLEETCYHRLDPTQGYTLQRIHTDDRRLDEALVVEDRCCALIQRGYHPVGAAHGYGSIVST